VETPNERSFNERVLRTPLSDLKLKIGESPLEPFIRRFDEEVRRLGLRIQPQYYLADEWGVPFGTIAIGIPFYLAHPDLVTLHDRQVGHIEGASGEEILRYLRHEMGHVVNYAYRLYDDERWVKLFGSMTQPYSEEYHPIPFSRRFVRHLPGWYAQKHPDEDWSETFAVWMTPEFPWRKEYSDWPTALEKLGYCDEKMSELMTVDPVVTLIEFDAPADGITLTAEQFYQALPDDKSEFPSGLDGAIRAIFEDLNSPESPSTAPRKSATELLDRCRAEIASNVFRWTGHFPERTHRLMRHFAERMDAMQQVYPADRERSVVVALTALVTSLAMNFVQRGTYQP
jgi:hypothetical protein